MTKDRERVVEFRTRRRNCFFHILTGCNLRCRHCYINPEAHGTQTLDVQQIEEWLRLFLTPKLSFHHESLQDEVRFKGKFRVPPNQIHSETNLVFLGGEPTLHPGLPHIIRVARDLGARSISVDTNGYLFHDFLDHTTPSLVDHISFSLDGSTPELNDAIRGKGSFAVCTSNLKRAISDGFSVSVIFTASSLNIEDLWNMPDLLEGLGVRRFFIQVVGIRGRPAMEGEYTLQIDRKTWEAVVPKVARKASSMGITVTYPKVYLGLREDFYCAGLSGENYFIFPNGRVYICPLCEDFPLHAYEIREGRIHVRPPVTEIDLFGLRIPEGCVMNRILHPDNIPYGPEGEVQGKVACCMIKEEIKGKGP